MTRGGKRQGAGRPQNTPDEALEHVLRVTNKEKEFIDFSREKNIDLKTLKATLLTIFVFIIFSLPTNSQVLTGGVEYTVDSARIIAFDNTPLQISRDEFKNDLKDFWNLSNLNYIKGGVYEAFDGFAKRKLVPFYIGKKLVAYGVQYEDRPTQKFYYMTNGNLAKYEFEDKKSSYPHKIRSYYSNGKLSNIVLAVSPTEGYVFNQNKELRCHWINDRQYDDKGNQTAVTRKLP